VQSFHVTDAAMRDMLQDIAMEEFSHLEMVGNVVRDPRANIAAGAGARQTCEALIHRCDDAGSKKVLTHLLTREITHADMFMQALDSMGKLDDPMFGTIRPDDTVNVVFNLSQGDDHRGPWNQGKFHNGEKFDYIEDPRPQGELPPNPVNPDDEKLTRAA
jgi:Mn-containing catalase